MKPRFTLFRRGQTYYCEDRSTGIQLSLRTKDQAEAHTLVHARNEAHRQPILTRTGISCARQLRTQGGLLDSQWRRRVAQQGQESIVILSHRLSGKTTCALFALRHRGGKQQVAVRRAVAVAPIL